MKKTLIYLFLMIPAIGFAQGMTLKAGDAFPAIPITGIMNAPVKSINLNEPPDKKFYILNFWGTWCSPCIPEMDDLAKLQKANADKVQIIGISDDTPAKLQTYLKNKPTDVWLATDTTFLLYELFNIASVSHSAIVDANHKIVAVMKTHSITQGLLDSLYRGEKIISDANVKEKPVSTAEDLFAVDSTLAFNFTVKSYMVGQRSMAKIFTGKNIYKGRRLSFINTGAAYMYKIAYGIVSQKQMIYEVDEKKVSNYEDKNTLYCVDLLVRPEEKDSLYTIFQRRLNEVLPVKARIEYKVMPVYVLINNDFKIKPSESKESSYGFSGNGYEGTAVTVSAFANDYLSNELDLPVVDETNLKEKFDIKTTLEMRTTANVIKSVEALGLKLEKQERKMKVMVLY